MNLSKKIIIKIGNAFIVLLAFIMVISILKSPEYLKSPITVIGGIILVEVVLNRKKCQFILDSGASSTIINKRYIKAEDLLEKTGNFNGISGEGSYQECRIKKLKWEALEIQNKRVIAINLSHLEAGLNTPIHGLIGFDVLKNYTMLLDYKTKTIELWQFLNDAPFQIIKTIPFILSKHIPVLQVCIGKVPLKLGIDTGASTNVIDIKRKVKLNKHLKLLKSSELKGGSDKVQQVDRFSLDQFWIDKVAYKNMGFIFTKFDHLKANLGDIDGLLGYEFLKRRKIALNFTKGELYYIRKKRS